MRYLTVILILLAGLAPAATVDFSTLLPTGAASTLPITITPLIKLSRSGTNLVAGIPLTVRPTNGPCPVALLGGLYQVSIAGSGATTTLPVPSDEGSYSAAALATNLVTFLWTNQVPLVSGIIAGSGMSGTTNGGVVTLSATAQTLTGTVTNGQSGVMLSGIIDGGGTAKIVLTNTPAGGAIYGLNADNEFKSLLQWEGTDGTLTLGQPAIFGDTVTGSFTGSGAGLSNIQASAIVGGITYATAYGATGNGTSDDTTAIQAALDAGKWVVLGPGQFKITSALRVPAGGALIGSGKHASIVLAEISAQAVPSITGTNMVLRDLAVSSSYSAATNTEAYLDHTRAIKLGSGCLVQNVGITNAATGFEMSAGGVCNVTLENITGGNLRNSLGYGEFVHGDGVSNVTVRGFACNGMNRGMEFENGSTRVLVTSGALANCYPTPYSNAPWGYYTNYGFTLDTHTHDNLTACSDITYRDISLDTVTRPITCGGASWADPVRYALYENIRVTNVVVMAADTGFIDIQYAEGLTIRGFQLAPQVINLANLFRLYEVKNSTIEKGLFLGSAAHIADFANVRTFKLNDNYFRQSFIGTLAITRTSNVATVTTDRPHTLTAGQAFSIQGIAASGYNGSSLTVVSVTTTTNFTFASTGSDAASTELAGSIYTTSGTAISDAGFANEVCGNTFDNLKTTGAAVIRQEALGVGSRYTGNRFYFSRGVQTASRARSSNVATIVTARPHGFASNDLVYVASVSGSGYTTTGARITTLVSDTSFSYASSGSNEGTTTDTGGWVYPTLGAFNTGTPNYAVRITGSRASVADNYVESDWATAGPRLWYVDSVVAGGTQSVLSGNRGYWANTGATVVESTAGSSNYVSLGNITSPAVWTHASPSYTSVGDMNGTTPVTTAANALKLASTNLILRDAVAGTYILSLSNGVVVVKTNSAGL